MRRHLVLIFSLLFAAAGIAGAGIANAGASTAHAAAKPHVMVKIVAGSKCKPAALFCFKPSTVSIAKGGRVTFKNTTITSHTVTRCTTVACSGVSGGTGTDTGFGSGLIAPTTSYKFVFNGAGTYTYYCMVHGYTLMHGTITVT